MLPLDTILLADQSKLQPGGLFFFRNRERGALLGGSINEVPVAVTLPRGDEAVLFRQTDRLGADIGFTVSAFRIEVDHLSCEPYAPHHCVDHPGGLLVLGPQGWSLIARDGGNAGAAGGDGRLISLSAKRTNEGERGVLFSSWRIVTDQPSGRPPIALYSFPPPGWQQNT